MLIMDLRWTVTKVSLLYLLVFQMRFCHGTVLTPYGTLEGINRQKDDWKVTWESKETECDVYGKCGVFGICNPKNSPICSCLRGYEPKSTEEWIRGNWTSGCVRKAPLQCRRTNGSIEEGTNSKYPLF